MPETSATPPATAIDPLIERNEGFPGYLAGDDLRVRLAESDQIVQAMLGNELPVTYVLYPDEGHGFARPQNRLAFYGIAEAFLADCLGGRRQGLAGALDGSSTQVPTGAEFISGLKQVLESFEPVVSH